MRLSLIERAFELADSGKCVGIGDIERVLIREMYEAVLPHLSSPSLRKGLNNRIRASVRQNDVKGP